MARARSYVRMRGSMGESTFVKQRNGPGYRVQDKLETTPGRIKTNPRMARVRENMSDFGRAAKAGKLLRNSISSLVNYAKDRSLSQRMGKTLMAVIKSDQLSPAGQGNVVDGNTNLLKDFQFNASASLESVFPTVFQRNINRVTGVLTIDIPVFKPSPDLKAPNGATHYQFVSAGTEVDFESGAFKTDIQKSGQLPYNTAATAALTLTHALTPNSTHPLFLVFGIRFFKQQGPDKLPLLGAATSLLVILEISKV